MSQNICNICGANYEYIAGRWKCPACGAYKTEELSNEEVTLLYNAAQKLRFANFDEAEEAYSDIIEKFPQNPEGYWGRLLSKYGIKYEEDFDGRKIPTCYATSIESVISDKDYLKAIELADTDTKSYYQKQAEYIERVRKEWVEKAKKEKPYDIFISYKESDHINGIERTRDSIEAQEIYIHLIEQGYRVFFSRESLRGKEGEKYEPYIFNALSTAKVMLVYGTSSEYITSTWIKNEWTRYEKRIKAGEKNLGSLIVACDGFSPNELPKILSSKQCFDATRKTFYLDLDKCLKRLMQDNFTIASPYTNKSKSSLTELHEHVYKTKVIKSTCVAKGYTIHMCDCGYEYRDSYTPLVDHKFKVVDDVPPTCTTDGRQEMLCEVCGEKETKTIPALKHNYSKWIESKHPTCTEPGEKQRRCTRCGEIEKNILPIIEHRFEGRSVNPDGTETSYCVHCGISKTRPSNSTSNSTSNVTSNITSMGLTIRFKDILLNIWLNWKSMFTNETTRMQKIRHWVGLSFLCSMMAGFIFRSFSNAMHMFCSVSSVIIMFVGIWAIVAGLIEKKEYRLSGNIYPKNKYCRGWLRILSNFLWLLSLSNLTSNEIDKNDNILATIVFVAWSLIAMIYAYFPKQYMAIQFAVKSKPVKRNVFYVIGILLTWAIIIIMGTYTAT